MVVRRTTFFITLFGILFIVMLSNKFIWLMHSKKTTGVFAYQGRGNALEQFRKTYYEAYFRLGNDTVWFRGDGNLWIKPGTPVPILYQAQLPTDARVYTFVSFWGGTVVYGGILLAVLLAIFLHPDIVPRRARLQLSFKKPFLQIV